MQDIKVEVFKASAGSGKTYTLALKYLTRIIVNPFEYKHILGVTFTNKATNEMKDRILNGLANLAGFLPEGVSKAEFLQPIHSITNLSEEQIQANALKALKLILNNYDSFQISTIDSFFQQIVKSFAKEAGLPINYQLSIDQKSLVEEVTEQVYLLIGKEERVTNWLVKLAKDKLLEGKDWEVKKEISGTVNNLLKESYYPILRLVNDPIAGDLYDQLCNYLLASANKKIKDFDQTLVDIVEDGVNYLEQNGLQIEDFPYGKNGALSALNAWRNKDYKLGKRLLEAIDSPEVLAKKQISDQQAIEIVNILEKGVYHIKANKNDYLLAQLLKDSVQTHAHISVLSKKISEVRKAKNILLVSDVQRILNVLTKEVDTPFVYEKTGSFLTQYFLDEFQDTSNGQWESIRPLLDNGVNASKNQLIVGDVKQSIYRWRSGDWRLMQNKVPAQFPSYIHKQTLEYNYRSKTPIIAFNNSLYTLAKDHLKNCLVADLLDKSTAGQEFPFSDKDLKILEQSTHLSHPYALIQAAFQAYDDVAQKVPAHKLNQKKQGLGCVHISFIDEKEEDSGEDSQKFKDLANQKLVEKIAELQALGWSAADMAILVRTNKEGVEIADFLNEYATSNQAPKNVNFSIVSTETQKIYSALEVRLMESAIQFLLYPNEKLLRMELSALYHQFHNIVESQSEKNLSVSEAINEPLIFKLSSNLYRLLSLDIFSLCSELATLLGLGAINDSVYLTAFFEEVVNYMKDGPSNLNVFYDWWQEKKLDFVLKSEGKVDAITLLTVHKSKGLEFPIVLMPYFNWEIRPTSNHFKQPILFATPFELESFIDLNSKEIKSNPALIDFIQAAKFMPIVPLKQKAEAMQSGSLSINFWNEYIQLLFDNLNVLYVATTRPKNMLFAWVKAQQAPKTKSSSEEKSNIPSDVSGLLNSLFVLNHPNALPKDNPPFISILGPENQDLRIGEPFPKEPSESKLIEKTDQQHFPNSVGFRLFANTLKLRVKNIDAEIEELLKKESNPATPKPLDKKAYGSLIHWMLSKVSSIEEVEPLLSGLSKNIGMPQEQESEILEQLNQLFTLPQMKYWFSSGISVKAEQAIFSPNQQLKRPDRVIEDKVNNWVQVIDFKTGKPSPDHHIQVHEYMALLQDLYDSPIQGYLVYIDSMEIIEV